MYLCDIETPNRYQYRERNPEDEEDFGLARLFAEVENPAPGLENAEDTTIAGSVISVGVAVDDHRADTSLAGCYTDDDSEVKPNVDADALVSFETAEGLVENGAMGTGSRCLQVVDVIGYHSAGALNGIEANCDSQVKSDAGAEAKVNVDADALVSFKTADVIVCNGAMNADSRCLEDVDVIGYHNGGALNDITANCDSQVKSDAEAKVNVDTDALVSFETIEGLVENGAMSTSSRCLQVVDVIVNHSAGATNDIAAICGTEDKPDADVLEDNETSTALGRIGSSQSTGNIGCVGYVWPTDDNEKTHNLETTGCITHSCCTDPATECRYQYEVGNLESAEWSNSEEASFNTYGSFTSVNDLDYSVDATGSQFVDGIGNRSDDLTVGNDESFVDNGAVNDACVVRDMGAVPTNDNFEAMRIDHFMSRYGEISDVSNWDTSENEAISGFATTDNTDSTDTINEPISGDESTSLASIVDENIVLADDVAIFNDDAIGRHIMDIVHDRVYNDIAAMGDASSEAIGNVEDHEVRVAGGMGGFNDARAFGGVGPNDGAGDFIDMEAMGDIGAIGNMADIEHDLIFEYISDDDNDVDAEFGEFNPIFDNYGNGNNVDAELEEYNPMFENIAGADNDIDAEFGSYDPIFEDYGNGNDIDADHRMFEYNSGDGNDIDAEFGEYNPIFDDYGNGNDIDAEFGEYHPMFEYNSGDGNDIDPEFGEYNPIFDDYGNDNNSDAEFGEYDPIFEAYGNAYDDIYNQNFNLDNLAGVGNVFRDQLGPQIPLFEVDGNALDAIYNQNLNLELIVDDGYIFGDQLGQQNPLFEAGGNAFDPVNADIMAGGDLGAVIDPGAGGDFIIATEVMPAFAQNIQHFQENHGFDIGAAGDFGATIDIGGAGDAFVDNHMHPILEQPQLQADEHPIIQPLISIAVQPWIDPLMQPLIDPLMPASIFMYPQNLPALLAQPMTLIPVDQSNMAQIMIPIMQPILVQVVMPNVIQPVMVQVVMPLMQPNVMPMMQTEEQPSSALNLANGTINQQQEFLYERFNNREDVAQAELADEAFEYQEVESAEAIQLAEEALEIEFAEEAVEIEFAEEADESINFVGNETHDSFE